jgi:hypothetical protein
MTELPEPKQFGDYGEWPGRAVLTRSGEHLGKVREIYLDDATDRPEWVLVDRDEREPRFIPLADAAIQGETIHVAATAENVDAAPSLEPSKQLTQDQERELYSHYGVPLDEESSDSILPATDDRNGGETPAAADEAPTEAQDAPAAIADAPGDEPPTVADEPPAAEQPPSDGGAPVAPIAVPTPAPPVATGPTAASPPEPVATGPTPLGDPPAAASELHTNDTPELPRPGQTSEPEDRGPMVPPRPEPVAPPRAEPQPESSGLLAGLRDKPVPLLAGVAAALAAAIVVVVRRRS